jgi:hypothetical protein
MVVITMGGRRGKGEHGGAEVLQCHTNGSLNKTHFIVVALG